MTNDQGPLNIHEAAAAMRAGGLTPINLLEQCLARIDRYEALVRAWVVIDRDGAREQTERLTDELKQGQVRGPLHGVPISVKDIIDVFDLPTGCGSKRWANSIARNDATCVKQLREAGAVILGKTVTTAYAYLDPPITRNPWDVTRTPGGSSSGSAAAVACGMCLAALGSQTGGSLTRPASFCGVASCKPSWGTVSVKGVLPLAPRLDHVGVIAQCVHDLNLMLAPMIPIDRQYAGPIPTQNPIRLARLQGPFEDRCDPHLWRQLSEISGENIEIIDLASPTSFVDVWRHHLTLMAFEAAHYHGNRFRRRPEEYPPRIAELIERGLTVTNAQCHVALAHRENLIGEMQRLLEGFDALLTAAAPGPAPNRDTTGDAIFNAPWSYLGLPTVSFPIGVSKDNLPFAAQLVGKMHRERDLLAVAQICEQRVGCQLGLPPLPE